MKRYFEAPKAKLIYVFRINDAAHSGSLKIGETTIDDEGIDILALQPNASELNRAARERIKQYTATAGISYDLLYTEAAIYRRGRGIGWFNDKEVHQVLLRSGIRRKEFAHADSQGTEWFVTDLATVRRAIAALKEGRTSLLPGEVTSMQSPIVFRTEQRDAIDRTVTRFRLKSKGNRMLWNAKMRFGKTLSALQVVKELDYKRTIIVTHRPVVDEGWFEDFGKIFYDSDHFVYSSKNLGEDFANLEQGLEQGRHYIYFASMQDLRGAEQVGGKFKKNEKVLNTPWDLVIVDEAHEGTQTERGENVINDLLKEHTRLLELSGTPFNLINNYKEGEIYTWDYIKEQRAKQEWDKNHFGDPNPYAAMPTMHIYTYDLGRLLSEFADEDVAFNFREFFRTDDEGHFVHESDVSSLLNLLTHTDEDSYYPFANDRYRETFRHTFWILPGVRAAKALSAMLQAHPVFGLFKIVNVAGEGDDEEENEEALKMVNDAIGEHPEETRTITLSCGRLTTGVTVRPWTGVLMLSGTYSTSASTYMQTIFRVQSPATINGRVKEDCYVFDFAPDRTLKVLATVPRVSTKAGTTTQTQREALGEFLNFCPVIAIEGSRMKPMKTDAMMQQLKRAYVEQVVRNGFDDSNLYNGNELLRLTDVDVRKFDELKGIIGQTKAMPKAADIIVNEQGLTDEQYEEKEELERKKKNKQLTEEDKRRLEELNKKNKLKADAISILRGISVRMPLLIYGAEIDDEDRELTIDNFTSLVDPQSWEMFMPRGVSKRHFNDFKQYYDPDVFAAAGKRIRAMARAADRLTVEERIERITSIFDCFHNPDKETVLTPWRVVCMHMSDTLGGYTFFEADTRTRIEEPRYVEQAGVTDNVFSPDTRLLEINSKTGLYPLYLAYNVYRRRLKSMTTSPTTLDEHQRVWDAAVAQNIFVVCMSPMAKAITRRTLMGFRHGHVNTRYFEDLVNQLKNKSDNFLTKVVKGQSYWKANNNDNMKFNAVVGNPPYQVMDGGAGASASPVYQHFVGVAKQLRPNYVSLIMPAKWYTDGKGLNDFRKQMFNDKHLRMLIDFTDSHECFTNADIAGGVCYFLWNRDEGGECAFTCVHKDQRTTSTRDFSASDSLFRHMEAEGIIEKVRGKATQFYNEKVSRQKPYGLRTYVVPLPSGDIKLRYNKGIGPYDSSLVIRSKETIYMWKVIISYLTAEHAGETDSNGQKRILSSLSILAPGEICTETYLVVDSFETEDEAINLMSYLKTHLVRFLIAQLAATQHLSKEKFQFVPLQDFTPASDIDWSQSVAEIDRQLYKKYGLTDEEVEFIERMIKPME